VVVTSPTQASRIDLIVRREGFLENQALPQNFHKALLDYFQDFGRWFTMGCQLELV
jgi:hypothetical protein